MVSIRVPFWAGLSRFGTLRVFPLFHLHRMSYGRSHCLASSGKNREGTSGLTPQPAYSATDCCPPFHGELPDEEANCTVREVNVVPRRFDGDRPGVNRSALSFLASRFS